MGISSRTLSTAGLDELNTDGFAQNFGVTGVSAPITISYCEGLEKRWGENERL